LLFLLIIVIAIILFIPHFIKQKKLLEPEASNQSLPPLLVQNPYQGVFQCSGIHNVAATDYLKGGGIIIEWAKYQPRERNQLDPEKSQNLINQLTSLKKINKKAYLNILAWENEKWGIVDMLPDWLNINDDNPNNDLIDIIEFDHNHNNDRAPKYERYPSPWDRRYQQKIGQFLSLINNLLEENNLTDTIEYIEPSIGGIWGSTHLWFGDDILYGLNEFAKAAGCPDQDWQCLGREYNKAINQMAAVYLSSFTDHPIMIIGGNCRYPECTYSGLNQLLDRFGIRVMYKLAGLGSADRSCGLRPDLFSAICRFPNGSTRCGQEPNNSTAMGAFDPNNPCGKNYQQVYQSSLERESISYYCLYSYDIENNQVGQKETNRFTASHVGAQIRLLNYNLSLKESSHPKLNLALTWQNQGSTALIAPLKEGEKWTPSSYQLFLEIEQDNQIKHYQEIAINPPTYTWQTNKRNIEDYFEVQTSTSINIPSNLEPGIYKIYVGLTDPNGERQRFALINNDPKNDVLNRRYLLTDSFRINSREPENKIGDLNNDGVVDEFDYGMLIARFGNEGTPGTIIGDLNNDGVVDEFDYGMLIARFEG